MLEARYGGRHLVLDDSHVYTLDGVVIPGNTTLLKEAGVVDDRWYNEASRIRGTRVHAFTHYYDENDIDWNQVTPEEAAFVGAWVKFREESGFTPWMCEFPVFHSSGFATTLDRVGELNGRPVIIEIKTGTAPNWVGLQTAAQMLAVRERCKAKELDLPAMPTGRFAVQLSADGKYKLIACPHATDEGEFIALFNAIQIRKRYRNV
jgi:hypothetical protein